MLQDNKNRLIYLVSLSLLLSTLEYLIPKPFPFLKLGLANLPLIVALPILSSGEYFLLAISKAIIQGIIGGTIITPFFLISLAGTAATAVIMKLSYKILRPCTFVGISVLGALASNAAQVSIAALLIYGKSILVAMPYIMLLGIITSAILGYLANIFYKNSAFIEQCRNLSLRDAESVIKENSKEDNKKENKTKNFIFLIYAFVAIILSVVLSDLKLIILILVLTYIIQVLSGRKLKIAYPVVLLFSMVLLSLFEPNGKVVFKYFTDVSLNIAFTKALRILILIASSQILVASTTINIGFIKNVFALSTIVLDRFSNSKGSVLKRIDESLIGKL